MNGYKKEYMGRLPGGEEIYSHTVSNGVLSISVLDYGAILQKCTYNGTDIVKGYATLEEYLACEEPLGAIVGRFANWKSKKNIIFEDATCIPSDGFDKKYWYIEDGITHDGYPSITCGHISPDGEDGCPGRIQVSVSYILKGRSLIIDYKYYAPFSKVFCNMTNHSCFNLGGHHKLSVFADTYSEKHIPVEGTDKDFRTEKELPCGYDCNFNIIPKVKERFEGVPLKVTAVCRGENCEISVLSSLPCLRVFSNHGICFEPQFDNDSIEKGISIVEPQKDYHHVTVFRFK